MGLENWLQGTLLPWGQGLWCGMFMLLRCLFVSPCADLESKANVCS